jgi:hypothetical protein
MLVLGGPEHTSSQRNTDHDERDRRDAKAPDEEPVAPNEAKPVATEAEGPEDTEHPASEQTVEQEAPGGNKHDC